MQVQQNAVVLLTAIGLFFAATGAHATHGNGGVPVSYNGSLDPSVARAATLTDGYDWYCFAGTPGTAASISVTTTSGTLLPNLELWSGSVAAGTPAPYTGLTNDVATNTSNDDQSAILVNYTLPTTPDGKYSVVVSTWFGETGAYSIALTGGQATRCGAAPQPAAGVATLPQRGVWLLAGLLGLTAVFGLRHRPLL